MGKTRKIVLLVFAILILFSLLIAGCNVCKAKEGQCCQGGKCVQSGVSCLGGTHPEFKGCNNMCVPQTVCTPN